MADSVHQEFSFAVGAAAHLIVSRWKKADKTIQHYSTIYFFSFFTVFFLTVSLAAVLEPHEANRF